MEAAFLQLIQEHTGILHKVCNLYCTNPADRQDLMQEMMLQLWRSFPTYKGEAKISTWMYRIVLNTAITAFRKEKTKPNTQPLDMALNTLAQDGPDLYNEQWQAIKEAMQDLSDIEKAIIILFLENKSYAEMEEVLGINIVTLRVKMNRIKDKLRKNLNEKNG